MSRIIFQFDVGNNGLGKGIYLSDVPPHLQELYNARTKKYGDQSTVLEYKNGIGTLSYKVEMSTPRQKPSNLNETLQRTVEETADSEFGLLLGILTKASTQGGMSSQLIMRSQSFALNRKAGIGDTDYLRGERDYEQTRHNLRVFYETQHYVDISTDLRPFAFPEMSDLELISDQSVRQLIAKEHPVFGKERKNNKVVMNSKVETANLVQPSEYLWGDSDKELIRDGGLVVENLFPASRIAVGKHPDGTVYRIGNVHGRVDVHLPKR